MTERTRVLVIDDDEDFQASLGAALELEGYEVIPALSGESGLEKLVERNAQVIVLDIMMESLFEGYSISHAIQHVDRYADYREIPVIMVSSIQEPPDRLFPRASEVELFRPSAYFTKPLDMPRFLGVLERVSRSAVVPSTVAQKR